ncbi:MAG: 7-cyano-7-deazaguanine synthase QueC [Candidatus Aminicenantes bacterium]|nr:MAG: 7-cyano-7-deazaguanine synthase QueC [Candidatus Aminicenantes bacterium]
MKKSIVLFSGGLDSTTAIYWALERYEKVFALTFDYGQRNRIELDMAGKVAQKLSVPQKILRVNLKQIGGSSLTDNKLSLPQYEKMEESKEGLPSTYVPFRNGIFLALAAAWAEVVGIKEIICGFNVIDSPNYPDTRKQFVQAMQEAINLGTKASLSPEKIQIIAPFLKMKKSDIIKEGLSLNVDYSFAISCYCGEEIPCQKCSSCVLRQKAWEEVGLQDPLILRLEEEGKI